MSANATKSPSQRAGGPGWCSIRDMRKSREIATENRVGSTFVIFPMVLTSRLGAARPDSSEAVVEHGAGWLRRYLLTAMLA